MLRLRQKIEYPRLLKHLFIYRKNSVDPCSVSLSFSGPNAFRPIYGLLKARILPGCPRRIVTCRSCAAACELPPHALFDRPGVIKPVDDVLRARLRAPEVVDGFVQFHPGLILLLRSRHLVIVIEAVGELNIVQDPVQVAVQYVLRREEPAVRTEDVKIIGLPALLDAQPVRPARLPAVLDADCDEGLVLALRLLPRDPCPDPHGRPHIFLIISARDQNIVGIRELPLVQAQLLLVHQVLELKVVADSA